MTVKLGPQKSPFTVQKALICAVSPYFQSAFIEDTAPAERMTTEATFKVFLEWLYAGGLEYGQNSDDLRTLPFASEVLLVRWRFWPV